MVAVAGPKLSNEPELFHEVVGHGNKVLWSRPRIRHGDLPFSAIVGHDRLRHALVLCAVRPEIGGVLIRGEKRHREVDGRPCPGSGSGAGRQ